MEKPINNYMELKRNIGKNKDVSNFVPANLLFNKKASSPFFDFQQMFVIPPYPIIKLLLLNENKILLGYFFFISGQIFLLI